MELRKATQDDVPSIFELYKKVSKTIGGLARTENEISLDYIRSFCEKALRNGEQFVVLYEDKIIADIHCSKLEPAVFSHILSDLTICVDSEYQGQGIGFSVFQALLEEIKENRPDISRVELIARESNLKAINMYEKLGFRIEGRMQNRIKNGNSFEADIPMAWIRK